MRKNPQIVAIRAFPEMASFVAGEKKGVRYEWCEAPFGPFVPEPLFRPPLPPRANILKFNDFAFIPPAALVA